MTRGLLGTTRVFGWARSREFYLWRLRRPPRALVRGSVVLFLPVDLLPSIRPWAALAAPPFARPLRLGAKVGLVVVPPMATGMPFLRAAPAMPPIELAAPPEGIMPMSWPAMPPTPAAWLVLPVPPPTRPVSLRMTW